MFITGTDTGVGKTTIACGSAAAFVERGFSVGVFKPIETGCKPGTDGVLRPADALRLRFFASSEIDLEIVCPYSLSEPLAPQVAAERAGVGISVEEVSRNYYTLTSIHDITLIEGAGGLMVPITADLTFAGLAARLGAGVLVVVGSRLGAINHALLTVEHARSLGLPIAGYVVNFLAREPDLAAQTNVAVLTQWLGAPLGVVPYVGDIDVTEADRHRLADLFRQRLRLDDLLAPL